MSMKFTKLLRKNSINLLELFNLITFRTPSTKTLKWKRTLKLEHQTLLLKNLKLSIKTNLKYRQKKTPIIEHKLAILAKMLSRLMILRLYIKSSPMILTDNFRKQKIVFQPKRSSRILSNYTHVLKSSPNQKQSRKWNGT